jgi:hypothetical protein
MPDIFPSADQLVADVTVELEKLEVPYELDYTYDARPYLRVSEEGHDKWKAAQPETSAKDAAQESEDDADSGEAASEKKSTESSSETQSAKPTPKRR